MNMRIDEMELWLGPRGVRCVLIPFNGRFQLRLMRDHQTIKTDVFVDEEAARAAALAWRRQFEAADPDASSSHP
jgi:hypothetical protein